jgi:hypothetical protein
MRFVSAVGAVKCCSRVVPVWSHEGVPATERDRLLRDITRFRLARGDMRQVVAAAKALHDERHNGDLCRALETAIVVCYARPFGRRNKVGALHENWGPLKQFPKIHAQLLSLRDKVYAHTDETEARQVVDVGALLGLEAPSCTEGWFPIKREALASIAMLANDLDAALGEAIDERMAKLT